MYIQVDNEINDLSKITSTPRKLSDHHRFSNNSSPELILNVPHRTYSKHANKNQEITSTSTYFMTHERYKKNKCEGIKDKFAKMPLPKLSNEETIKFVKLYKAHPCLWKTDIPTYNNKVERRKAINEIVAEMNRDDFQVADCQIKIKNVRSHYLQELKKICDSKMKGIRKEGYVPQLSWFKLIDGFLWKHIVRQSPMQNYLKLRKTNSTEANDTFIEPTLEDVKQESLDIKDDGESFMPSWNMDTLNPYRDGDMVEDFGAACNPMIYEETDRVIESRPSTSRRYSNNENGIFSPNREEMTPRQVIEVQESEFDIFGKGVAAQLKAIPLIEAVQLQLKIQQMITEHRLRIFMGQVSVSNSQDEVVVPSP